MCCTCLFFTIRIRSLYVTGSQSYLPKLDPYGSGALHDPCHQLRLLTDLGTLSRPPLKLDTTVGSSSLMPGGAGGLHQLSVPTPATAPPLGGGRPSLFSVSAAASAGGYFASPTAVHSKLNTPSSLLDQSPFGFGANHLLPRYVL